MTAWLDPLRLALDSTDGPVWFFFRDDDAGWADDALEALLDVFGPHGMPLDVAAIPCAMTDRTVRLLTDRQLDGRNDLRVHQHGFAHVNHEAEGRKCEFGAGRSPARQADDIARGRELLRELLGELPGIFTPPWNRCAPWTATLVHELGFEILSRDLSAGRAGVPGLQERPVTVDWFAKRKKAPVDRTGRGELLATAAAASEPVGVMLHHEVMSDEDRADVDALLELVAAHPAAAADHLDGAAFSRVR